MKRWTLLSLASPALVVLCALQLLCLLRAPATFAPSRIAVHLAPGESMLLGRHELGAPGADASLLGLRRDAVGNWMIGSASGTRSLLLQRGDREHRTDSIVLQAGQRFQLGASVYAIEAADGRQLSFADGAHRWHYDGATLTRDGHAQPACPDAHAGARLAALWNRSAPSILILARPLSFGGNLRCGNRLGIAGIDPASASIARVDGALALRSAGNAPLLQLSPDGPVDLDQREESLDGVTTLAAGRMRLRLAIDGDTLLLQPLSHVALFAQPRVELPPQVHWEWRQRDPWALPLAASWQLALGALVAIVLAALSGWYGARLAPAGARIAAFAMAAGGAAIALAGVAAIALQRAGMTPGHGMSLLLAWAALWYALLAPRRPQLVTAVAVLLLAAGLLAQLEQGLGAMESSWLRPFQKTCSLLAPGLAAGTLVARWRARGPVSQTRLEWLLLACAAVALLFLLLQVLFGGETGVFDLQPVEFAKLVLAVLTAHCLALAAGTQQASSGALLRWLRPAAPAVLFVVLLAVALVQVDDYSPLVLLLVWGMAMMLAWSLATRHRAATAALVGAACAAVLTVAGLHSAGAAEVASFGFYADRFLVWLDPAAHPHTGQQLLLGARALADGGWRGADGLFGLSTLGQAAGEVLRVPAVQDDFAPSFFLNRHGLAAGLALWALQALFLVALLQLAFRTWLAGSAARDFRHAWVARFRCFALCGGAAFVLGHFILSWGTNLAIFPIMGQPMSFLSAGGSHLLFFICPLLGFAAASVQSLEESQSCRSTSNMKP